MLKKIFFFFISSFILASCSSVNVPQAGAQAPCQIQLSSQVEQAIYTAIDAEDWKVIAAEDHWIEAQKTSNQMQATVEIAYGYRGFSIEYHNSQNMDYDAESDTINRTYVKWVVRLRNHISEALDAQAAALPADQCMNKNIP